MPKIVHREFFDGSRERLDRLGMMNIWTELEAVLTAFEINFVKTDEVNAGAKLRKLLSGRFRSRRMWRTKCSQGNGWTGSHQVQGATVSLGVQLQFSVPAESDLLLVNLQYLRDELATGRIDVGALVVPSDNLCQFLTDGVARISDALKAVERTGASYLPLVILALDHDRTPHEDAPPLLHF
jgi:hypothetical protein